LYEKEKEERKKGRKKMTESGFFGSLFLSSHVLKRYICEYFVNCYRQYYSLCMLALGFVTSLTIISELRMLSHSLIL